jgi:hypothetical protein
MKCSVKLHVLGRYLALVSGNMDILLSYDDNIFRNLEKYIKYTFSWHIIFISQRLKKLYIYLHNGFGQGGITSSWWWKRNRAVVYQHIQIREKQTCKKKYI